MAPSYRRRIFLIDKKFQFRIALYVCAWVAALGFVHPLVVHNLFELFMSIAVTAPLGSELDMLRETRQEVMFLMILTEVAFLALTFFSSLFLAHRIAGPIWKLRQFIAKAKTGDYVDGLRFRQYDHFKYLADEYNELMQSVRGRMDQAAAEIEKSLAHASPEGRQELEKALLTLRQPSK